MPQTLAAIFREIMKDADSASYLAASFPRFAERCIKVRGIPYSTKNERDMGDLLFSSTVRNRLLGENCNCDRNGMRRQAGVGITGLVVQASLQNMLAALRRQVRMQNKLSCVDAKLLLGCNLKGISGTRREVDRGDVESRHFNHRQPRRNQRLLQGCVGVDVQSVGYAKVKVDLGGAAHRHVYLRGRKELDNPYLRATARAGPSLPEAGS